MRVYLQIYIAVFLLRAGLFGVLPFFSFSRLKDHLLEKNKKNQERMW